METESIEQKEPSNKADLIEPTEQTLKDISSVKGKIYVYPIRDWKEYLGESVLIIFSVLLALFVTEYISKLHERENTRNST